MFRRHIRGGFRSDDRGCLACLVLLGRDDQLSGRRGQGVLIDNVDRGWHNRDGDGPAGCALARQPSKARTAGAVRTHDHGVTLFHERRVSLGHGCVLVVQVGQDEGRLPVDGDLVGRCRRRGGWRGEQGPGGGPCRECLRV